VIVFESVSWKNFLSTGNFANKIELNKHQTTLVVGKNGEGKSTVLDALCFGLFGKPFRNINKGQLINSINQKNCLVEICFKIGSVNYKVVRGIKPNKFEIYQSDELINQDAAAKDYQKVLEQQILKLNYKTFTQVVILGSASFVPFMQLPSATRREVIEDILDIRIFSTMNQILKEKIQETKDELVRIEHTVTVAKTKVENQQQIIKTLTDAKKNSVAAIEEKILSTSKEIASINASIAILNDNIVELQGKITDSETVTKSLDQARNLINKKNHKTQGIQDTLDFFEANDTCPSCAQGIPHTHKQTMVQKLREDNEKNAIALDSLESALEKLTKRTAEIQKIQQEITAKTLEISGCNSSVGTLNKVIADLLKEKEKEHQDGDDITEEKRKLKELANEAMQLIDQKTSIAETRNLQEIAGALLKDTGIKTSIIREYLPAMNKLINKYLTAMDFYVHFELDESFNEVIKSRYRDEFTYASFSEGEKMRIDLAILFTWRQIAKLKNSVNTNLLILDEIFDSSLDVAGTDYFLSVMSTLGENTNVFVISHKGDQLVDKFQNVIRFEKKNDFSIITNG
jgi:DNA repair exonuclease SbcCD ATPase subunit